MAKMVRLGKPRPQKGNFSGVVSSVSTFYSEQDTDYYPAGTKFVRVEFKDGSRGLAAARRFNDIVHSYNQSLDTFDFEQLVGKYLVSEMEK